MTDDQPKYTDRVRRYGIIEVSERVWEDETEWKASRKQRRERPLDSYFPPLEWLENELSIAIGKAGEDRFLPHTDWGWYVERMLANSKLMHSSRDKGEIEWACIYAVELGQLMAESRIKFEWEPDALHGRKRLQTLAESRDAHNSARALEASVEHEKWQAAADRIWQRNPALSKTAVAQILARDTFPDRSVSTLRQSIQKS